MNEVLVKSCVIWPIIWTSKLAPAIARYKTDFFISGTQLSRGTYCCMFNNCCVVIHFRFPIFSWLLTVACLTIVRQCLLFRYVINIVWYLGDTISDIGFIRCNCYVIYFSDIFFFFFFCFGSVAHRIQCHVIRSRTCIG